MTDKQEKNQIETQSDPLLDTQWLLGSGTPAEGSFALEDILAEVAISEHVKAALLSHEGRGGMLYDLLLAYERADWSIINRLGEELGLPMDRLPEIYFQCLDSVNQIWQQLMSTGAAAAEE